MCLLTEIYFVTTCRSSKCFSFFRVSSSVLKAKCSESLKRFSEMLEAHHETGRASLLMGVSSFDYNHYNFYTWFSLVINTQNIRCLYG